jgi:hypothetical protein
VDRWQTVRDLQADPVAGTARLVVITNGSEPVPGDIRRPGTAVAMWPFAVTDLVMLLGRP